MKRQFSFAEPQRGYSPSTQGIVRNGGLSSNNPYVGGTIANTRGLSSLPSGNVPTFGPPAAQYAKRQRIPTGPYPKQAGGNSANFGGTPDSKLREIAGSAIGSLLTNTKQPAFDIATTPQIGQFRTNNAGMPTFAGMPEYIDPFARGMTPIGPRGYAGMAWRGMPEKPNIWDVTLPGTATSSSTGTQSGIPAGSEVRPPDGIMMANRGMFNTALDRISSTNLTGSVNARTKYTHILDEGAAEFAEFALNYFLWFTPISLCITERNAVSANSLFGLATDPFHQGYALPAANYMIATQQSRPESVSEVTTVVDIASNWNFLGVIAAEHGEDESAFGPQPSGGKVPRKVVMQTQGEMDVFNIWGKVHYGSIVGFIIKGVRLSEIYADNHRDFGSYNLDPRQPGATHRIQQMDASSSIIQIIPWCSENDYNDKPLPSELAYHDSFGIERRGKFVRVGRIVQVFAPALDKSDVAQAAFSSHATFNAGKLRILLEAYGYV